MWNELRYTLKMLRRHYAFTLLCASVLALGLGILLPAYTMVYNLTWATPDFPQGDRLIAFSKDVTPEMDDESTNMHDAFHYRYFKENSTSFDELHVWREVAYTISDGELAQTFKSAEVEPGVLNMPQQQPERGRLFSESDLEIGASPVAIISYEVWQTYYAGRDDIIGVNSRMNSESRTVVGVMPQGYRFPMWHDVWVPLDIPDVVNAGEGEDDLRITGRLKDGVSLEQAKNEIDLLQTSLVERTGEEYRHIARSAVGPYISETMGGGNNAGVAIVFVVLLLLFAFNVGNLLMARGEERLAELAVRSALGASAARVGWSLLLESFVVCCCGLAGGLLLGSFTTTWTGGLLDFQSAYANLPINRLFWWDMSLNVDTIAASAVAVFLIYVVGGGATAWQIARTNLGDLLANNGKGHDFQRVTRFSKILVNLQLVIGCVMLTYGVSFGTSLSGPPTRTPDADRLFLALIPFSRSVLTEHAQQLQYLDALARALANEAAVAEVAFTTAPPGGEGLHGTYNTEDMNAGGGYPEAYVSSVSAKYFDLLNVALTEGRYFSSGDTSSSLPVVIVDDRLAQRYWPGISALGKRIQVNPETDQTWYTIVGVTKPVVQEPFKVAGQSGQAVIYHPVTQRVTDVMNVMARMNSLGVVPADLFRGVATSVNRDVAVIDPRTLQQVEDRYQDLQQLMRKAAMAFVVVALYVTGIATYGLASRIAGRRRLETGIRMALGATDRQSLRVFVADGFRNVVIGLGIGGVLSIPVTYAIFSITRTANFGTLVPTLLVICAILGTLVMLANYIPARRIIALEPADALRYE